MASLQGSDGRLRVQIERKQRFTGEVQIALSNPPPGVTAGTVVAAPDDAEAPLPIRIATGVATGALNLTVSGTGGGVTTTTGVVVNDAAAQPRSFMEQKGGAILVGEAWERAAGASSPDEANNGRDKRYVGLDPAFPDQTIPGDIKVKSTPIAVGTAVSLEHDKPVEPLAAVCFAAKREDAAVKKRRWG